MTVIIENVNNIIITNHLQGGKQNFKTTFNVNHVTEKADSFVIKDLSLSFQKQFFNILENS